MRVSLKLPGATAAVSSVIVHYISVFAVAFLTQVLASYTGAISVSTLESLLVSGAAAGVIAVIHVIIGMIPARPAPLPTSKPGGVSPLGIPLKVKTAGYQVLTSVAVVFISILGAELVSGAAHVTSFPDGLAVLIAAISAAVTAVVQYFVSLVPAPKA